MTPQPHNESRHLDEVLGEDALTVRTDAEFGWRGEGFVRLADGWLSIPCALPGETLRVDVEAEAGRGRRAFASIVEIVEPSPHRTDPHCDRVDVCRGCQLRTVSPARAREFKRDRIVELLEKFGGFDPATLPVVGDLGVPNERSEGYRWRSSLTYRSGSGGELGLVSASSSGLISMSPCPSLEPELRDVIAVVESVVLSCPYRSPDGSAAPWPGPEGGAHGLRSIAVAAGDPAQITLVPASPHAGSAAQFHDLATALHEALPQANIGVSCGHDIDIVYGSAWFAVPYLAHGLALKAQVGAWTHATRLPAEALYDAVWDWLGRGEMGPHLDVGCAIGAVSLLAASQDRAAVGIDCDVRAIASATESAREHQLDARFVASDWEKGLRDLHLDGAQFASASLNPMREPMGSRVFGYLAELGVRRLLYLGPSPEASARDFARLSELGWRLDALHAVDLHPASYQVMVGAEWTRTVQESTA